MKGITYGHVAKNVTTAIFRGIEPASQKHLIKSMKGPMGDERKGHKYVRRKWNAAKQNWDYIYKDAQGKEHIGSKLQENHKPEKKKKEIEPYYKEMTAEEFGKNHNFILADKDKTVYEEARKEGKKIRATMIDYPFGRYLLNLEKIDGTGQPKSEDHNSEKKHLNDEQETAMGELRELFGTNEYIVYKMDDQGVAYARFDIHKDIGGQPGIKSAFVKVTLDGAYKIRSYSSRPYTDEEADKQGVSEQKEEPEEKSEYDKINEEYNKKGYVYIKSRSGNKFKVEKYEPKDGESGHKVTNLETGVKYGSVGRSGSTYRIFRQAELIDEPQKTEVKKRMPFRKIKKINGIREGDLVGYVADDGFEGHGEAVSYADDYWEIDDLGSGKRVKAHKTNVGLALRVDRPQVMSYDEIHDEAHEISGGFGFWGAMNDIRPSMRKEYIRAWVDALREKGYSDRDIILYGDWRDGRHIADEITRDMGYDEFKEVVKKRAADPKEVKSINDDDYKEQIESSGLNKYEKISKTSSPKAEKKDKESLKKTAEQLMNMDNKAYDYVGVTSGGEIRANQAVLKKYIDYIKADLGNSKFPKEMYSIFEDENYHTLNSALIVIGAFEPPIELQAAGKEFQEYARKSKESDNTDK